jgi:hypothetical protein
LPILVLIVLQSLIGMGVRYLARDSAVELAYIDPGSGALLMQVLVSVGFGIVLSFRRARQALFRLAGRIRGRGKSQT